MAKVFSLNAKERKACVALARKSLEYFFSHRFLFVPSDEEVKEIPSKLKKHKACFVTLMLSDKPLIDKQGKIKSVKKSHLRLRGCIGHLQAIQPLYLDIIENAVSAAFKDMRFSALNEQELPFLEIEVSVLTDPEELKYSSPEDLMKKIRAGKDGIIIKKGYYSATFLPSVWEELDKKEDFLSHLCVKAGLNKDAWKIEKLDVQRYEAIKAKQN